MPFPALGGSPLLDNHLLQTLARATGSGKETMIVIGVMLACVINGDTVSGVLRQATWLVIAIIVLTVVQAVALNPPRSSVKPANALDTSG
jgi:hypothetical protein